MADDLVCVECGLHWEPHLNVCPGCGAFAAWGAAKGAPRDSFDDAGNLRQPPPEAYGRVRMRLTMTGIFYSGQPGDYGTDVPAEMAAIDEGNAEMDPVSALDWIVDEEFGGLMITVTPEPLP